MKDLSGQQIGAYRLVRIIGEGGMGVVYEAVHGSLGYRVAVKLLHDKLARDKDIVHHNIFLIPEPDMVGGERVNLLDFGIAKIATDITGGQQAPAETRTGTMMGIPLYMSPEQCRGIKVLDGKADIYSLGVVRFQLLIGTPPSLADGAGQVMAMHMRQPPPLLHKRDASIDIYLTTLVKEMLAKEAASRPSVDDVLSRLETLGVALAGTTNSIDAAAAGKATRRREFFALTSLCAVTLLALLGLPMKRSRLYGRFLPGLPAPRRNRQTPPGCCLACRPSRPTDVYPARKRPPRVVNPETAPPPTKSHVDNPLLQ